MRVAIIRRALISIVIAICTSCGPIIHLEPGVPTSDMVLSRTSPAITFEQFILAGRSYTPPLTTFELPAGEHAVRVAYRVTIPDRCDSAQGLCSESVLAGRCSGSFHAEPNERYRILIAVTHGGITGTVQLRAWSALYLGQDEAIVGPLNCENISQEERTLRSGSVGF